MRPRVAKSGTIHVQHSMFADEHYPPKADTTRYVYTITFSTAYEGFLEAYRKGEPPDTAEVVTDGGYAVEIRRAVILDADDGEHYDWTQIQEAAHTAYQAETADDETMPDRLAEIKQLDRPKTHTVTWARARDLMLEALREGDDPWYAAVLLPDGEETPLYACQVEGETEPGLRDGSCQASAAVRRENRRASGDERTETVT